MTEPKDKVLRNKKDIIINNFLGGISWAFGATVGLAFVLMILGFVLKNANVVPYVGDFIVDLNQYVLQKGSPLVK